MIYSEANRRDRPELQGALLLLANLKELLDRGSIVIFEAGRLRVRNLPILQTGRP